MARVEEYLETQDPEKVKAVYDMGITKFIKVYNSLCRRCQLKVGKNSEMSLEEYCPVCQKKIARILG